MNRHVGASFTLSVLVVAFFAVVLYPGDERPARSLSTKSASPDEAPPTGEPEPRPAVTPGVPWPEASARVPAPAPRGPDPAVVPATMVATPRAGAIPDLSPPPGDPIERPVALSSMTVPERGSEVAISERPRMAPRQVRRAPERRSGFTHVAEGESLTDVARRVYGSAAATQDLWLANRDMLASRDAPLSEGMLLRTP